MPRQQAQVEQPTSAPKGRAISGIVVRKMPLHKVMSPKPATPNHNRVNTRVRIGGRQVIQALMFV
jgi:hypothetical protein